MIDVGFGLVELDLGTLLLILSLIAILLDGIFVLFGRYIEKWEIFSEISVVAGSSLLIGSFLYYCYSVLTADYSFVNVSRYVSDDADFVTRLSAIWSGEAGSYFLWAFFLVAFYLIFRFYFRDFAHEAIIWRAFVLASIQVAFIIALTLLSLPFETNENPVSDGWGLNPLLRNIWNTLHPPPIFLGYAACMLPTVIGIARISVMENGEIPEFEGKRRLNKFFDLNVALAWFILSLGIIFGGYWAYVTLGWGGFWAWDPVETASLIPWLFLTVYYHGTPFHRKNKYLANYVVSMTYISALLATLVTRSNILTSVHSFAQEENILLMFLHLEFADVLTKLLKNYDPSDSILFLFVFFIATFLLPLFWGIKNQDLFRIDLNLQRSDFQGSKAATTALKVSYIVGLIGTYVITLGLIAPIIYDFIANLIVPIKDAWGPSITIGIDYYNTVALFFGGIVLIAGFFCKFYPNMAFKAKLSLLAGGLVAGILFYAGGRGMFDSSLGEDNPVLEFFEAFWTTSDKANLIIPLIFLGLVGTLVNIVRLMIQEEMNFFRKSSQSILHFSLLLIILGALLSTNKVVTADILIQEGIEYPIEGTSLSISIIDLDKTLPETGRYMIEYDISFTVQSGSRGVGYGITRLAVDKVYGPFRPVTILSDLFADVYVVTVDVFESQITGQFEAAMIEVKVIPYINVLWAGCFILALAVLPLLILRILDFRTVIKVEKGTAAEDAVHSTSEETISQMKGETS